MAIYDELRQEYDQWSKDTRAYWFDSGRYALQFAAGFREYLGAPEFYNDHEGQHPYVELCKVVDGPSTDESKFEPTNFHDALTRGEDGLLTFGVSIIIEKAQNTFPKASFGFSIGMLPRDGQCTVKIAGERFELDMTNEQARIPAYKHMLKVLRQWLASKPWDANRKNPIGFVHSP
jgi:hypothetical protein